MDKLSYWNPEDREAHERQIEVEYLNYLDYVAEAEYEGHWGWQRDARFEARRLDEQEQRVAQVAVLPAT